MSSSSKPPTDAAIQQRIIKHMNADHHDSLIRFLEHHHSLSSSSAGTAHLEEIQLGWLLISFRSPFFLPLFPTTVKVPFEPPLGSYKESRERLVAMDRLAIKALGRDDITVKEYIRPRGFHTIVLLAVILTVSVLWTSKNVKPGSIFYDVFLHRIPTFARFLQMVQPIVFGIIVTVHPIEAYWMDRTRLRKHSVPRLSVLWWKWMLSALAEGAGSFMRLDALVKEKKEKLKH